MRVVSPASAAAIAGKRVLVTGAGGSIGSELCRQMHGLRPGRAVMLDHDESNLHRLQLELWGEALLDTDDVIVADIRDRDADPPDLRASSARRSSSTRRPTSTCRCSSGTPARA